MVFEIFSGGGGVSFNFSYDIIFKIQIILVLNNFDEKYKKKPKHGTWGGSRSPWIPHKMAIAPHILQNIILKDIFNTNNNAIKFRQTFNLHLYHRVLLHAIAILIFVRPSVWSYI